MSNPAPQQQQQPNIQNGNATVRRKTPAPQAAAQQQAPQAAAPQQAHQATSGGAVVPAKTKVGLPSDKTMQQAVKLSIKLVKPICFYFYVDSLKGKVSIMTDGDDKIVFKNEDEHTSPITNTFKCENEYIIITENTIYVISSDTKIC